MTSINELKQIAKRSGVPEGTIKNIFADPDREVASSSLVTSTKKHKILWF